MRNGRRFAAMGKAPAVKCREWKGIEDTNDVDAR